MSLDVLADDGGDGAGEVAGADEAHALGVGRHLGFSVDWHFGQLDFDYSKTWNYCDFT